MLIGLNGRLKSGKDTAYTIIKELHPEAERISFAEKLKQSAAASIGMTIEELEFLKNREDIVFRVVHGTPYDPSHIEKSYGFTARQYLQWYGTEGHRDVFGTNFWVDQALPMDTDHSNRLLVVTDMRFPNEAQRVLDLGGYTVKIERETETAFASHASEQDIDSMCGYFIDNSGSLDELRNEIEVLLEWISSHHLVAHSSSAISSGGY